MRIPRLVRDRDLTLLVAPRPCAGFRHPSAPRSILPGILSVLGSVPGVSGVLGSVARILGVLGRRLPLGLFRTTRP
jgi:hypothetical protein